MASEVRPAEPKRRPRFVELDALRGVSALAILILHAYQNSRSSVSGYAYGLSPVPQHLIFNLDFGLGVFFALSGFVIFLPFARALIDGRDHMGVKEFALRRLFRIVPLYYVAVFIVWNSRYYGGPGQIADLIRHLTFTQLYSNDKIFYTIGPAWSLAAEIHYYALTGFLIWGLTKLCRRVKSRRVRIALVTAPGAIIALASIAFKAWAWYGAHYGLDNFQGPKHYVIYYSALARADAFGFGMLLAVGVILLRGWQPRGPWLPRVLAVVGLATFAWMIPFRSDSLTDSNFVDLFYYTFASLSSIFLMAAIVLSKSEWPTMRVLHSRPLQFLGVVSYSLYLWHEPLMLWFEKHHLLQFKAVPSLWPLSCAALIVAGLALSTVSYHVIEKSGERLRTLLRVRRPTPSPAILRGGALAVRPGTPVGSLPPLVGEDGSQVPLRNLSRNRPLVAFLQPRVDDDRLAAECVAEARAFSESKFLFDGIGVDVVAINTHPPETQRAVREREQLPFPVLSDPGCAFAAAAGVPIWQDQRGGRFAERVALLIDSAGTIRDMIGGEVLPAARASVAAARSEALVEQSA